MSARPVFSPHPGDGAGGALKRPAGDAGDRGGNKAARASPASGTTSATCAPPKPISMSLGGLKKAPLPPLPSAQKPAKAISIRLGGTVSTGSCGEIAHYRGM